MELKKIISKMTLKEKASLMSGKTFWETMDIDRLGIPSIFLADGPHGIRKQAVASDHLGLNESIKATCFPTAATVANSFDVELGEQIGEHLGKEAVAQSVNVLLGPGINIKRNPRCGRNFEYFSEDPYMAGKMAASYIKGIQSNGISACVKHYAANNQEERRMVVDSVIDERTLREIYLTNFEIAVKEGKTKTLMTAYNRVNGAYANESEHLLLDILRKEWGYDGVVVTDWGGCNDRVEGLRCSNELEMPTTGGETNNEILEAVKSGKLDEKILDEAIERLLKLIFETDKTIKAAEKGFDIDKHHTFAQKVAEESSVLLKNENDALPLKKGEKVLLIGDFARNPRFQGAGSSVVNPTRLDRTGDMITSQDFEFVAYCKGYNRFGEKKGKKRLLNEVIKNSKDADTLLLYLGLDEATETEGLDRKNCKLPQNQLDLINTIKGLGKKIVVVLCCGSYVELDFAEDVNAILHAYLSGQAGAGAILNILTGKINPSGKLAESYPFKYEDCSSSTYFPGKELSVQYREGLFVGYRYYDTAQIPVRYPFGYGLSYTKFEYSNLILNEKGVKFTLKNTGKADGKEICQLYVGAKNSKIFRAKKELKGFTKIELKAGEEKIVEIPFDEYTFRFFNVETNKWEIEPCEYEISVAASSHDIRLLADITKQGEAIKTAYSKNKLAKYYSGKVKVINYKEFTQLLGTNLPEENLKFVKKNRILVQYNTTVTQLKFAKGWTGRFFAWGINFAYKLLYKLGKRSTANVIMMGMYHMPIRGLSRMTGGMISWAQLDGLILMFNGKFFKGIKIFFKEGKKAKKEKRVRKNESN